MEKKWSRKWVSSKQPRKQRKYLYNAPLHVRRKLLSAHLAPELKKAYGRRSLPIRKGDEVEVMRGENSGIRGVIGKVDLKKTKVYVETIKVKKADGTEVMKPFRPSNLKLVRINLDDKERQKSIARVKEMGAKAEKPK